MTEPAVRQAEVQGLAQGNLAVELLREIRSRKNLIYARSFAPLLEQAIRRCQNRAIETAQVIEELIALAREMRQAEADRARERAGPATRAGQAHPSVSTAIRPTSRSTTQSVLEQAEVLSEAWAAS